MIRASLLYLAASVVACTASPPEVPPPTVDVAVEATPAPASAPRDGVAPATVNVVRDTRELPHPRAELRSTVPVLRSAAPGVSAALETINRQLAAEAERALAGMAALATADEAEIPADMHYYLDLSCDAVTATTDLVSVHCIYETFSGGAHPNRDFRTFNFTLLDGRAHAIELATLLSGDQARAALGQAAANGLRAQGASAVDEGPLRAEQMQVFTLEAGGLHLHFAPYVVGSYAEGAYDFVLPWSDALGLLRRSPATQPVLDLARSAPPRRKRCVDHGGHCEDTCDPGFVVTPATGCGTGRCCVPEPG